MKKSRRSSSFWTLSTLKNEDVSQNCFVFDVVNLKNEEVSQKLLYSFLRLSTLTHEEVSQNSLVFKLADRQVDR